MNPRRSSRRTFIKGSLSAVALSSLPGHPAFAQTTIRTRPEWQQFKTTANYASFIDAIRTMRANTNANDRSSWQYWTNVHVNYCPHSIPYLLAWHRGYLYYFEQQLRIVSGNTNLVVPFWDYYKNPNIPSEFTDSASGNPLYVPRVNTNVYSALTLAPFGPTVWNFQRGLSNAYEPQFESAPHNPVHNIIGGVMQTMQSPLDPIFFLHHANVDRLWHAWALPDGKGIPGPSTSYWAGNFTYASDLTLQSSLCYHPNWVGTDYSDDSPPTSLPPIAQKKAHIIRVQAQQWRGLDRPPVGALAATAPRPIDKGRRSVGGASDVGLSENSVSVGVMLHSTHSKLLQTIVDRVKGKGTPPPADSYKSVNIVLDTVSVLPSGKFGGYFYKVYLNLPDNSDAADRHFLGTVGPFEVEAASHHGSAGYIEFPASEVLANVTPGDIKGLTVSLVRVSGDNSPRGRAILIREVRVEVSTDEPFDLNPPAPGGSATYRR